MCTQDVIKKEYYCFYICHNYPFFSLLKLFQKYYYIVAKID